MGVKNTPWYRKKTVLLVLGLLVIAGIVLGTVYGDYLTTKVAPGKKFKILGPSAITAGQAATITWDVSTETVKKYPYEKIEYCYGSIVKRKCVVLAASAPNTGKAVVKVPASLPAVKGFLKFTARDPQKKLLATFTANSSAVASKPAVKKEASSGGSGGGSGSGGGGSGSGGSRSTPTPVPPDEVALSGITLSDRTLNAFRVSFNTSLPVEEGYLSFRKKGTEDWNQVSHRFFPSMNFSLLAENVASNTEYEYKVKSFRYKNQDCRSANCAYEIKESGISTVRTSEASSPFQLTYVQACYDTVRYTGSQNFYPVFRLAWESDQVVSDTDVHFVTRKTSTSTWYDWWSLFSPNDPNYGPSRYHYNGANKQIRINSSAGSISAFDPNTAYEFQLQDGSGRTLTNVIPFTTTNAPSAPSSGLSTCRDNMIHEQGTPSVKPTITIMARNPSRTSTYTGYFWVNPATRQISYNPDPTKILGTMPTMYCGPISESGFSAMKTILTTLQGQLPIEKIDLGLQRGVGKESIVVSFSDHTSYELTGYGNTETDFPEPLRAIRKLLHEYAHDYCSLELTFP